MHPFTWGEPTNLLHWLIFSKNRQTAFVQIYLCVFQDCFNVSLLQLLSIFGICIAEYFIFFVAAVSGFSLHNVLSLAIDFWMLI